MGLFGLCNWHILNPCMAVVCFLQKRLSQGRFEGQKSESFFLPE